MRIVVSVMLFLCFFSGVANGRGLTELVKINDFKILSSAEEIRVVIKTSRNLSSLPELRALNEKLLQLELADTYTDPPKRRFTVGDSFLEKIHIYQLDKETVRVRLSLAEPFQEGNGNIWADGEGFVISLKRKEVVREAKDGGIGGKIEASFPTIFAGEENSEVESKGPLPGKAEDQMSNPILKMAASLAFVIGLFLVGSYFFREKFLKKGRVGKDNLIRVIDRGYIDVKKGITIVEVAGEILVLGTSGESITMLTKLEDEDALKRLKPLRKRGQKGSFPHAIKLVSDKRNVETSDTLLDRVRSLKKLV